MQNELSALARRVAGAAVLFWLVVTLIFALIRMAPGDPAEFLVPPTASARDAARLRAELGLDRPLAVQYARWAAAVVRGDLGESFASRQPVSRLLLDAAPVSFALGGISLALTFLIGVPLGMLQSARRGGALDRAATVLTTAVYAAPTFWIALALVAVFTYGAATLRLPEALRLPAFGVRTPGGTTGGFAGFIDLARHAVLPVATLAAVGAAGIARYARSAVADVLNEGWVGTARAKGAGPSRVFGRHVLRNVTPQLVVLGALSLPGLVAGSVFVESVFAWPGLGRVMLVAIQARDYPVVMGATVFYAAAVIVANLAADIGASAARPAPYVAARVKRFLVADRTTAFALGVLSLMVAAAILVPMTARQDPLTIGDVLALRLVPPLGRDGSGAWHLLGTDRFGRDLFVRMMLAARVSLAIGVGGSLLAAAGGTAAGALAAWMGGITDAVTMALADALLAIPRLVLLLVCAALWRPGLLTVLVVLGATGWMGIARIVRGEVLGVRARPFVEAADALGVSHWRVLWRHVLPSAVGPAIVATTLGVGNAILLESGLSFLGLGIQPPSPSWGNMIAGGRDLIVAAPWVSLAPGVALIATVLAVTLLGDRLRDAIAGRRAPFARQLAERS